MNKILVIGYTVILISMLATGVDAANITLEISGTKSDKGNVLVQLYDTAASWKTETGSIKSATLEIEKGRSSWIISDLPEGQYAIRSFHDKNTNQKIDTNFFGVPEERYGFSNNARGSIGPPSWKEASFTLGMLSMSMKIELK